MPLLACTKYLDTTIKKWQLDSIRNVIFNLKDSTRRLTYINKVLLTASLVDTTSSKSDSTVILFKSPSGKILKRVLKKFRRPDCITSEKTEYMNEKELPEFIILFERACFTKEEFTDENRFEKLSYYYERRVYDTLNRLLIKVFWYPRVTTIKYQYSYDMNGNKKEQNNSINYRNFWD